MKKITIWTRVFEFLDHDDVKFVREVVVFQLIARFWFDFYYQYRNLISIFQESDWLVG